MRGGGKCNAGEEKNTEDICDRSYILSSTRTKLSTCRYKSVHWIQSKNYTLRRQPYVFNAAPRPGFCPASVWTVCFSLHTSCEPYLFVATFSLTRRPLNGLDGYRLTGSLN